MKSEKTNDIERDETAVISNTIDLTNFNKTNSPVSKSLLLSMIIFTP